MIESVRCDKPSFRPVMLRDGFNVVLADRTDSSTDRDTRNGSGKSTLIEIIHFCLGASLAGSPLKAQPLAGWTFAVDLKLNGKSFTASRNTSKPNTIMIEGPVGTLPISPMVDEKTGKHYYRLTDWTVVLGKLCFGLPVVAEPVRYGPRFRNLFAFFARHDRDAFTTPFESHRKMKEGEKQTYNAFLLGMNWEYAIKRQELRDESGALDAIKRLGKAGTALGLLGSAGELNADRVRLELAVKKTDQSLKGFRVHSEYEDIERQANAFTKEVHELVNLNVTDARRLEAYRDSIAAEKAPNDDLLLAVYKEAGAVLGESVKAALADVRRFHANIIQNRSAFLATEIERIERDMSIRSKQIVDLGGKRTELMTILSTHGALEEFTRLQRRHVGLVAELKDVEHRLKRRKEFDEGKTRIAAELADLVRAMRDDWSERSNNLNKAVALFNQNSEALLAASGKLVIDVKETGYSFGVDIMAAASAGIASMKVFCYDMMLAQLWNGKPANPGILVHDSALFDSMDERQIAHALRLAASESKKRGFQYICTLNSDRIPSKELTKGFDIESHVCIRLTDREDSGRLLGIRF